MDRVFMLGLDGLSPDLLFVDFWAQMPNFRHLAAGGFAVRLRSCEPPITVPAWACMMTGQDPGMLGCYGFHDRADRSYGHRRLASSLSYTAPPLWARLSEAGVRCRVVGVPQTYPVKPLLGTMVSGALTPDLSLPYAAYPNHRAAGLQRGAVPYRCDVPRFRSLSPAKLRDSVAALTAGTFALIDAWLCQDDWDFFLAVDMGADRLQHGLWAFCRAEHPLFVPGHPLQTALLDYYRQLDVYLGRIAQSLRQNDLLMVVSDHGAQAMHGGFALNDWLVAQGLLVMRPDYMPGPQPRRLDVDAVDWRRTRAWGDGGYVGRIYLNIAGREPAGVVAPDSVEALLTHIQSSIEQLAPGGVGPHRVHRPQALYAQTRQIAPDLLVYMGGLGLRVLGTLGHADLWPRNNDSGFDAANHAPDGILVAGPCGARPAQPASLYDIAPSVLNHFGLPTPGAMLGRNLFA